MAWGFLVIRDVRDGEEEEAGIGRARRDKDGLATTSKLVFTEADDEPGDLGSFPPACPVETQDTTNATLIDISPSVENQDGWS
jgi:hypothetical protein